MDIDKAFQILIEKEELNIVSAFVEEFGLDERKIERLLINDYKDRILEICSKLTKDNYTLAVEIASIPDQIRGFGYIKNKNIEIAKSCEDRLMSAFNG